MYRLTSVFLDACFVVVIIACAYLLGAIRGWW
jgi:hypothetical protein